MMPYNEVFERVEKKYLVKREERSLIESVLSRCMQPDEYGCSRITSLYLDTEYDEVVVRSLEKPLYKEKIRLRAYGDECGDALLRAFSADAGEVRAFISSFDPCAAPSSVRIKGAKQDEGCDRGEHASKTGEPVFCELKKKYAGVVYKRRVGLSLAAAVDYLHGEDYGESCHRHPLDDERLQQEALCPLSMQIFREIDAARSRYADLRPRMAVDYLRTAWIPQSCFREELGDLRITFDGRPRCWPLYRKGMCWIPIVCQGESIMEVKSSAPFPLWLAHAFSENGVPPRSFTKYGTAHLLVAGSFAGGSTQRWNIRPTSNRKD